MGARVIRDARSLGLARDVLPLLLDAHDLAMTVRDRIVRDDHHPDYLHPGRTALVAMTDGEVRDADLLRAVILFDSMRPELTPSSADVAVVCGSGVEAIRASFPGAGLAVEVMVEELLALERAAAVCVLAEALDHARHAHVGEDPARMRATLDRVARGYRPVAERVSPALASRLGHWARHFRKRLA
jgi:hypothetical protein